MQVPRYLHLGGSVLLIATLPGFLSVALAAQAIGQQPAAKMQTASAVTHLSAALPGIPAPMANADPQASILASPLKITLTPSEVPIKLGSNSNIAADLQNLSNLPVVIDPSSIQLMSHAILSTTDSLCVVPLAATTNSTLAGQSVVLQPQDHLTVFFNLSERPYTDQQEEALRLDNEKWLAASMHASSQATAQNVGYARPPEETKLLNDEQTFYQQTCAPTLYARFKRAIDFTPGNYAYFISGRFGVCDPSNPASCNPTRAFAQNATFPVGIDQMAIIVFAILGGLLAYFVVSVRGPDGALSEFFNLWTGDGASGSALAKVATRHGLILSLKILRDVVGVAILAAAFTIVTSRLSDSQFPIKISVLDGWGAITVGFLSYFVGNKFIDSLHDMVK